MGRDKKHSSAYQCRKCGGVSVKKKDVCKPGAVDFDDLSKKQRKLKPCKSGKKHKKAG